MVGTTRQKRVSLTVGDIMPRYYNGSVACNVQSSVQSEHHMNVRPPSDSNPNGVYVPIASSYSLEALWALLQYSISSSRRGLATKNQPQAL